MIHVIKNYKEFNIFINVYSELFHQFLQEYLLCFPDNQNVYDTIHYFMKQKKYTLFIMSDKNKNYTSCALLVNNIAYRDYTIKSVCVGEKYRGKGICNRLITYIITYVKTHIKKSNILLQLHIDSFIDNIPASKCYSKLFKNSNIINDIIYFTKNI